MVFTRDFYHLGPIFIYWFHLLLSLFFHMCLSLQKIWFCSMFFKHNHTIFTSPFLLVLLLLPCMPLYCICLLAFCSSTCRLNLIFSHSSLITPSKFSLFLHSTYTLLCFMCFLMCKLHSCLHLYSSQCLIVCFAPSTHFLNVYSVEKTTIK